MKKIVTFIVSLLILIALTACAGSQATTTSVQQTSNTNTTTSNITVNQAIPTVETVSVAEAIAENSAAHDDAADSTWDSSAVIPITLNGDSISADGTGVSVEGSIATITAAGTYSLSGLLADGQIVINTQSEATVQLILNGVDLRSSTSAPIYVTDAEEVVIILAENTQNSVFDATTYVYATPTEDEPNAAIFSKADLTITGSGSLTVSGNANDGIASKDGLVIASGTITVNAVDDGIRGKDYIVVKDGNITVNAQGDGLKSDNEEDPTKGYIAVENGTLNISAGGDAIAAQTDVLISGGTFTLAAGGGSGVRVSETVSAKGIKGVANVTIDGGSFTINSADDAIHSNNSIIINGGTFNLSSGDDGMHADSTLTINNGEIQVVKSYEGIESAVITFNAGSIHVNASDDGINVAGGNDSSGMMPGGRPGSGSNQDAFSYTGAYHLYINGGTIVVEAGGDGIDVNGAVVMTGGMVLVNGPTEQMNGPLDYDAGFNITGGLLVAAGSAGMAQAPGSASTQSSVLVYFTSAQAAGSMVHIQNSAGEDILTFAPTKDYQSLAFSSPELANGETYEIFVGGSSSGSAADGLYQDGTYTSGKSYASFTVSNVVTTVGTGGGMGPGRRP